MGRGENGHTLTARRPPAAARNARDPVSSPSFCAVAQSHPRLESIAASQGACTGASPPAAGRGCQAGRHLRRRRRRRRRASGRCRKAVEVPRRRTGASPTNIRSRSGGRCRRRPGVPQGAARAGRGFCSERIQHRRRVRCWRGRSVAATQLAVHSARHRRRSSAPAESVAKTENCSCTFGLSQSGQVGVSPLWDQLFEMRLALHARTRRSARTQSSAVDLRTTLVVTSSRSVEERHVPLAEAAADERAWTWMLTHPLRHGVGYGMTAGTRSPSSATAVQSARPAT